MKIKSISKTRKKYDEKFPDMLDDKDWHRFMFSSALTLGNSVLNIGTGTGVLENHLVEEYDIKEIYSVDKFQFDKLIKNSNCSYIYCDLLEEEILDLKCCDTVFCLEVIEHIHAQHNESNISKLLSLAKRRLVFSVPYMEPEPLWCHNESFGHKQNFDLGKLKNLFPNAFFTVLPRYGIDWAIILVDKSPAMEGFIEIPYENFLDYVNEFESKTYKDI